MLTNFKLIFPNITWKSLVTKILLEKKVKLRGNHLSLIKFLEIEQLWADPQAENPTFNN